MDSKKATDVFLETQQRCDGTFSFSIESTIVIQLLRICRSEDINLQFIIVKNAPHFCIDLNMTGLKYVIEEYPPEILSFCVAPIAIVGKNKIVAGLSAVCRQIVKACDQWRHLLGFRESCLAACSEASVWTMFCEVDMPTAVSDFLLRDKTSIASVVTRFEYHLGQPVRMHNIYKNDLTSIPSHVYAEGPFITLSDVILYPCIRVFIETCSKFADYFPLVYQWYRNLECSLNTDLEMRIPQKRFDDIDCNQSIATQSLYKSDTPNRKSDKKFFTKQTTIEKALDIISNSGLSVFNANAVYGSDIEFDWEKVPVEVRPTGGSVPKERAGRKCEQLESMAKPVMKIVGDARMTIVDFCSGSGHLGLLLACLLPHCRIVLVENKEASTERAMNTIERLKLTNVVVVQCNLDYFAADFDLGVALHACGTVTDLAIRRCIEQKAHFVCCPCCYGSIKSCHLISYPKSEKFLKLSELSMRYYVSLAHAADQTHDLNNAKTNQGYKCMDVIDTDRILHAEENGYDVFLGKLQPVICTNKNNLIVGLYRTRRVI